MTDDKQGSALQDRNVYPHYRIADNCDDRDHKYAILIRKTRSKLSNKEDSNRTFKAGLGFYTVHEVGESAGKPVLFSGSK
jgi:hypothetical protein